MKIIFKACRAYILKGEKLLLRRNDQEEDIIDVFHGRSPSGSIDEATDETDVVLTLN